MSTSAPGRDVAAAKVAMRAARQRIVRVARGLWEHRERHTGELNLLMLIQRCAPRLKEHFRVDIGAMHGGVAA